MYIKIFFKINARIKKVFRVTRPSWFVAIRVRNNIKRFTLINKPLCVYCIVLYFVRSELIFYTQTHDCTYNMIFRFHLVFSMFLIYVYTLQRLELCVWRAMKKTTNLTILGEYVYIKSNYNYQNILRKHRRSNTMDNFE